MQKNLTQFKMGYGPMSLEIISILQDHATKEHPLMVIGSRNQVDYVNGYVCQFSDLQRAFSNNSNILLCRDHCGPFFKDTDKGLSIQDAISECKKTISYDIEAGVELIHVDVSRVDDSFAVADELINYALNLNPRLLLEFGSEENTGENLNKTLSHLDEQLSYCQQYKNNIKFFVSQTGSFIKSEQLGSFNLDYNKTIANKIHAAGFLFKEHNGDYITNEDLILRKQVGIDAINVAPQLGVVQTKTLYQMSKNSLEWDNFANKVYSGKKYHRWLPKHQYNDALAAVMVSGHYFFNTDEYNKILDSIGRELFFNELTYKIIEVLDTYKSFK